MTRSIRFAPVPDYAWTPTFMSLPNDLEVAMRQAPRTLERLEGCLYLAARIGSVDPAGKSSAARAGTYFRGSLADYASIDDMVKLDFPEHRRFILLQTQNPLPHILKLLRHLQIHLVSSRMNYKRVSLWLKLVPGAEPVDCTAWFVDDLLPTQLLGLDAFTKRRPLYTSEQAKQMVEWFEVAQQKFGIADLIWRGAVDAAERLIAKFGLSSRVDGSPRASR